MSQVRLLSSSLEDVAQLVERKYNHGALICFSFLLLPFALLRESWRQRIRLHVVSLSSAECIHLNSYDWLGGQSVMVPQSSGQDMRFSFSGPGFNSPRDHHYKGSDSKYSLKLGSQPSPLKTAEPCIYTGMEQRQLVWLITRRSQVQILLPDPSAVKGFIYVSLIHRVDS